MPPVVAFMDLLFLVPITMGAGLLYLVVASWWAARRRGAGASPTRGPGPQAGSAADAPTAPVAVLAAGAANDAGGDDFEL